MKCTRRLVYCNDQFHVILPDRWVEAVNIHKGDHVTLEIDDNDFNKLIIKKVIIDFNILISKTF
jgi:bifunctional DNA-binding transcriptional regulator/antitoxin component of YhaV-PrlF toxin-antitoxin module